MNVAFPRQGRITHEARQTNINGGTTWCGITFYWSPVDPYAVPAAEAAECDCMACIARPEIMVEFHSYQAPGIYVTNERALAKLEFLIDDKEPT